MEMPWRHRLRLLRRGLWYALALALVMVALLVTVVSQLLPVLQAHPAQVAAWLSQRAGRPVAFDRLKTAWTRRGPLLQLDGLRIGAGAQALAVGDAELLVAPYTGWLPGHSLTELRLRGLALTLLRGADGQWQVRGLPGQQTGADPLETLSRLGELQLAQARLQVLAPDLHLDVQVPRIDLRLRVNGTRVEAGARAWLRTGGQALDVAGTLDRGSGDGRLYAGSRRLDLAEFPARVSLAGITPQAGRGQAQVWATLRGFRIVGVRAITELDSVVLAGTPWAPGQPAPRLTLGPLVLDAEWAGTLRDWRARAYRLRLGAATPAMDGLAMAGGRHWAVRARHLQLAPWLQLATLSDVVPPRLRDWLQQARPDAALDDVMLASVGDDRLHVAMRVSDLQFDPVGHAPGLRGVAGRLTAIEDGVVFAFDPAAQAVFDWPAGFGVAHPLRLRGEAVAWRDPAGWAVQTPGLALESGLVQVQVRGGIGFQRDGSRPHLDLAADIGDVPVTQARGFWIHYLMPRATVDWLDAALRGGTLHATRAVVAGDLDDWPFRDAPGLAGAGVFRVETQVQDGVVKFRPDWPAAEHLDAAVAFVADGFRLDGKAQLAGLTVSSLQASIPSFHQPVLDVQAAGRGDARQWLGLLRASPLHTTYAAAMDSLELAGPAQATLQLNIPLSHDGQGVQVAGRVDLDGVRLRDRQYALAFEQLRGPLQFDQNGFAADAIQLRQTDAPGVLAVRAGPGHVRDPAHAFEAQLQVALDIDSLLDRAGDRLAWLKPWLQGSAPWTVSLALPRAPAPAGSAQLQLASNLVGTAFALPAPLRKPAAQALPTRIDVNLASGSQQFSARLGDLLALRGRSVGDQTGLSLHFGGDAAGPPPASGVLIDGTMPTLDALGWLGVLGAGRGSDGVPLPRVDVQADRLMLLGAGFADARLRLTPGGQGLTVQLQGNGLEGTLRVPQAQTAAVTGQFDRLYWTWPEGGEHVPSDPAAAQLDPAAIPPLALDVADLRIGGARFGKARFRSVPVTGGMRLDEFTTTGGPQRVRASGSWLGQRAAQRTRLNMEIDSDDAGTLLAALGFAGQIGGGHGRLGLNANWQGGPADLDLRTVEASLTLDLKDGRLLELEPGAGRLLGLFGIGQLRRRLMLDFSDFFRKGFTFDRIQGNARVDQGMLHTDNLAIRGPAADILVRGDTDLRHQRFDQRVDVQPRSAGLLTAVGALAGGPVGAAVGAVANAVLDKPMRDIGAKHYRITGPWEAPKIEDVVVPGPAPATVSD